MTLGGHAPVGRRHQLRSGHERGGKANQGDREDDAEYGAQVYRHLADVRGVDRDDNGRPGTANFNEPTTSTTNKIPARPPLPASTIASPRNINSVC